MENLTSEFDAWRDSALQLYQRTIEYLPDIIGALLILVLGWIIAKLLAKGAVRLANTINAGLDNTLSDRLSGHVHLNDGAKRVISRIVFWVVILLFVTLASRVAGLDAFFSWLDRTVTYLPTLIAGILIIAGGYFLSVLARDITASALDTAGVAIGLPLARAVQYAIFFTAIVIGVDQIGIDVSFLVTLVDIAVAAVLGGIALAFALGARDHAANLIASRALQQQYSVGQRIRLGDIEGDVLSLTATGVVLQTPGGQLTVPAKSFNDQPSLLVESSTAGDKA